MSSQTNRQQLEQQEIIKPNTIMTPAQEAAAESLTQAEVDCLIGIKNKLGPFRVTPTPDSGPVAQGTMP